MSKATLLAQISKNIADCKRCNLWQGSKSPVPGEGSAESKIVFVGEAPGFYEDQQGRPFVGPAGKLLDKMLHAVSLKREEVFITNTVKHRPPENRDPTPGEISACKAWLDQQIEILKPKIIVTLGKYSMAKFLPGSKISVVHGKPVRVGNTIVIPMYHPAAALRNGSVLEALKKDFEKSAPILQDPETALEKNMKSQENNSDQFSLFKS